ncbi:MAG: MFS transporter [Thiobacillus sp.]
MKRRKMPNKKVEPKKESFFRKWAPVFVLSLALAIILIDATLLNVSLSTLVKDLNTDIQSLQWVITAYSLTIASLTITGGRLGDLFGRKKMFVIGAALFAVGSFIASISTNVPMMIIGESIIEGVGAALMMPATASLLVSKYNGRDRGIAFGIWGGVAAASKAIGPLLGGYLTTYQSWRWGFRINVFVAAVLILGSFIIKEYREKVEKPTLDFVGVLLSSFGMFTLVYGIIEASTYGWWTAKQPYSLFGQTYDLFGYSITPFAIAIGLIFLTLFLLWERRVEKLGKTPLVSLHLFSNKSYVSSVVTTSIFSLGQAGLIFSVPVFLQAVRGASAFETGLAMIPMSITALFIAPVSGFLSHKVPPKRLVQIGLLAFLIGYSITYLRLNVNTTAGDLALPFVMMGLGMGMMMSSISNMALSAVSPEQSGEASGVNNTLRQVGQTLGTAIVGAVLLTAISTNLTNGINNSTVIPDPFKKRISLAVSSQTSNVEFGGGAHIPGNIPTAITDEITKISHQATTDANKEALSYAILFGFIGLISTIWLPGGTNIEFEKDLSKKK